MSAGGVLIGEGNRMAFVAYVFMPTPLPIPPHHPTHLLVAPVVLDDLDGVAPEENLFVAQLLAQRVPQVVAPQLFVCCDRWDWVDGGVVVSGSVRCRMARAPGP